MVRQMHPTDVKAKLDAGDPLLFVDVRQPEEYALCRIEGSVLIPLGELTGRAGELDPPDGAIVVVYCHHGIRSLSGAALLTHAGIPNAVSMAGGIEAWSTLVDPTVPRY